jgi:hypothetical protein
MAARNASNVTVELHRVVREAAAREERAERARARKEAQAS